MHYQTFSELFMKVLTNLAKMVLSGFTGKTSLLLTAQQVIKHKTNVLISFARVILSQCLRLCGEC